jgi:hypothetical protein
LRKRKDSAVSIGFLVEGVETPVQNGSVVQEQSTD